MEVKMLKCPHCGSEDTRKSRIGANQHESKNTWKCLNCGRFFYVRPERLEPQVKPRPTKQTKEEIDPSVNNPDDSQEDGESDVEEDEGLLEESDYGW
jgi:uncharacterized Zn finger protein